MQTEFITNADACGDHVFTQIARKGDICLYKRTGVADGRPKGLELFKVKLVKAGAALPGGNVVEADYESYPGKSAFGKTALSIGGIGADERAQQLFDIWAANPDLNPGEVTEAAKGQPVTNPLAERAVVVTRSRSKKKAYEPLPLPAGEFTREDFAKLNGMPWQPVNSESYGALAKEIKAGRVTAVKQVDGAKGRKRTVYVEIKPTV
jgi:hypothetical protein